MSHELETPAVAAYRDAMSRLANTEAGRVMGVLGFEPCGVGGECTALVRQASGPDGLVELVVTTPDDHAPAAMGEPVTLSVLDREGDPLVRDVEYATVWALHADLLAGTWDGIAGSDVAVAPHTWAPHVPRPTPSYNWSVPAPL